MVPDLVRPSVTEIQVRMDCNGCIHKIKKALHGINGIYDVYIDLPQQKLTVIGWADPEKVVNAIRKTRKIATICSYTEPTQQTEQEHQEGEEGAPPPEEPNPPPEDVPPEEPIPQAEPPPDLPPPENPGPVGYPPPPENPEPPGYPPPPENPEPQRYPPMPENPHPEELPIPTIAAAETNAGGPSQFFRPKYAGEVHVHPMYQTPPDYPYRPQEYGYRPPDYGYGYGYRQHGYNEHWNRHPQEGFQHHQPNQPMYVNHNYNISRPSAYVTEYEYMHSPPRHMPYSRGDNNSSEEYNSNNGNGNISSMFSDENPNACSMM